MLMHSQLALMAQPAECQQQQEQDASQPQQQAGTPAPAAAAASSAHISRAPEDAAQEEAAALLERCFAAAASTMPSTGSDFSLSGSTAVMCLVQPGRWVPWVVCVHGKVAVRSGAAAVNCKQRQQPMLDPAGNRPLDELAASPLHSTL
jgi:hypothetical protein